MRHLRRPQSARADNNDAQTFAATNWRIETQQANLVQPEFLSRLLLSTSFRETLRGTQVFQNK
jgi:hypothetical protein